MTDISQVSVVKRMKFEIVTDSSADLSEGYAEEAGIAVVPFYVSLDSETYLKEGKEVSVKDFYQAMIDHSDCYPKTSCPSIQDYIDTFLPIVKQGKPLLCLCLTQKFSASYQSAVNARLAVLDDYPEAEIYVMDTQVITILQGIFVKEAVRLRDMDLSLTEAVPLLEEVRSTGHIFFTTKDLKYLQHGGRLGRVAGIAGSVLNLKPLLHFHNGKLGTTKVCRGRKQSLKKVVSSFADFVEEQKLDLSEYLFGTGIGAELPEYEEFQDDLKAWFRDTKNRPGSWVRGQIGATVGVHTGPYPIGLGLMKKCNI